MIIELLLSQYIVVFSMVLLELHKTFPFDIFRFTYEIAPVFVLMEEEVLNNLASKGEEMDIVCVDDFEAAGLRRAALRAAESRTAKSIECALL